MSIREVAGEYHKKASGNLLAGGGPYLPFVKNRTPVSSIKQSAIKLDMAVCGGN